MVTHQQRGQICSPRPAFRPPSSIRRLRDSPTAPTASAGDDHRGRHRPTIRRPASAGLRPFHRNCEAIVRTPRINQLSCKRPRTFNAERRLTRRRRVVLCPAAKFATRRSLEAEGVENEPKIERLLTRSFIWLLAAARLSLSTGIGIHPWLKQLRSARSSALRTQRLGIFAAKAFFTSRPSPLSATHKQLKT